MNRIINYAIINPTLWGFIMKKKLKEITDSIDIELPYKMERDFDIIDISSYKDTEVFEYLKIFTDRIISCVDDEDLTCFYNNINRLKIRTTRNDNSVVRGAYSPRNIIYIGKDYKETIFHELTHLASTKVSVNTIYTGFLQQKNNTIIGRGLNEGYTQLETKRNFSDFNVLDGYGLLSYYCELLEYILGEDFLRKCYYNADLYSVVDELKKYTNINDIMTFLNDMDYLKETLYSEKSQNINKFKARKSVLTIKRINAFYLKLFLIKSLRHRDMGLIDEKKHRELLLEFIQGLVHGINISNRHYEIYEKELDVEFEDLIDEVNDQIYFERVLKK